MSSFKFTPATRRQAKLRLALIGVSGSGKTLSALRLAKGLGGRVALIDTERGSSNLYAGRENVPDFDVLELAPPFEPRKYAQAIKAATDAGYDVVIVDSISHAWEGEGGALDMVDSATKGSRAGNSYTAWRSVTPEHNKLVNQIISADAHVICTMRAKTAYEVQDNGGKKVPVKIGLKPVQREGMEYEFTLCLDISAEHIASAAKDRTEIFNGRNVVLTEEHGQELRQWLLTGEPEKPKADEWAAVKTLAESHGLDLVAEINARRKAGTSSQFTTEKAADWIQERLRAEFSPNRSADEDAAVYYGRDNE